MRNKQYSNNIHALLFAGHYYNSSRLAFSQVQTEDPSLPLPPRSSLAVPTAAFSKNRNMSPETKQYIINRIPFLTTKRDSKSIRIQNIIMTETETIETETETETIETETKTETETTDTDKEMKTRIILNSLIHELSLKELVFKCKNSLMNELIKVEEMENGHLFGVKKKEKIMDLKDFLSGLIINHSSSSDQLDESNNCLYLNTQYTDDQCTDGKDCSILKEALEPPLYQLLTMNQESRKLISLPRSLIHDLVLQQMTLWIGGHKEVTSSGLHHDFHDNFYFVIQGKKTFTIYPPSDYPHLYLNGKVQHLYENGLFVYQKDSLSSTGTNVDHPLLVLPDGSFAKDVLEWKLGELEDLMDSPNATSKAKQTAKREFKKLYAEWQVLDQAESQPAARGSLSAKTVQHPPSFSQIPPSLLRETCQKTIEESAFPLLSKARPTTFTLHAGDMLYLPCGWFHEVQSTSEMVEIDGQDYRAHIALNYWYAPPDNLQNDGENSSLYKTVYWQRTFGDLLLEEVEMMLERKRG